MIVAVRLQNLLVETIKLLFPPIPVPTLKGNEKNDASNNPRPHIVGHT